MVVKSTRNSKNQKKKQHEESKNIEGSNNSTLINPLIIENTYAN